MNRKYLCKCGYCNHYTEFKNPNDSYIVCEECHRVLNISASDFITNGKGISKEQEIQIVNTLNMESNSKEILKEKKSKQILLEGDDLLDDFM